MPIRTESESVLRPFHLSGVHYLPQRNCQSSFHELASAMPAHITLKAVYADAKFLLKLTVGAHTNLFINLGKELMMVT